MTHSMPCISLRRPISSKRCPTFSASSTSVTPSIFAENHCAASRPIASQQREQNYQEI